SDRLERQLARAGLPIDLRRAGDRQSFAEAIAAGGFDLVLADPDVPGCAGLTALAMVRERWPEIPFIFIARTAGEEAVITALRRGATDYVLKRNLARLPGVIRRAIAEATERRDRQRAETALADHALRLRLALSAARLGTWDYTPQTDEIVWGDGTSHERRVNLETYLARVHAADRAKIESAIQSAMAPGSSGSFNVTYRVPGPGRSVRWMAVLGQCFGGDGEHTRYVGVIQDITDQKAAEATLQRQNRRLAQQVENRTRERDRIWQLSRDLMIVCDHNTIPVVTNAAWTNVLGWPEAELLAMPVRDLVHPGDPDPWNAVPPDSRQATRLVENRMRRKDGSYRWIAWNVVADAGLVYAIGRDVAEEKAAKEELAAAHQALIRNNEEQERVEAKARQMQRLEAIGQLTSGVAHDFNNLLTVVLGNSVLLQRELSTTGGNERLLERLTRMTRAAQRGALLTKQLLAFSRRQRLQPKQINLNDTVEGMRDLLQTTLGAGVHLRTDLQPDLWAALVDPAQLELIVLNLAINGRDAMANGGELTVTTSNVTLTAPPASAEEPDPGAYAALSITDTGTGMTEQVRGRAFEPFFTTKEVGKGAGLGLAQVYGFAMQSGGGVRIDTTPGEGTSVSVYLPRAEAAAMSDDPASHKMASEAARGATILLV
ncbi:MAG TPA: ATP-binding protein, partial [Acetobacteraceae bacterium]